jgi:hypothetical protein
VEHRRDTWGKFNADDRDALEQKRHQKREKGQKRKKKQKESLIGIDPFAAVRDRTRVIHVLRLQPNLLHYLTN